MSSKKIRRFVRLAVIIGIAVILYALIFNQKIGAGEKLPSFTVYDINGKAIDSKDFSQKPLILLFWGQWCDYCRMEMHELKKVQDNYPNVEVIAIHEGASREDIKAVRIILKTGKFNYNIYIDRHLYGEKLFGIDAVPVTFLVDKSGVIVKKFYGVQNWGRPKIGRLLEKLIN